MKKLLPKKSSAAISKILSVEWKRNEAGTELTLTKKFSSYLHAFMFVTRVSINAEVLATYPEILLTKQSVKITIGTGALLVKTDYEYAQRIDVILLSTKKF